MGRPRLNLVGQRFTRLIVLEPSGVDIRSHSMWLCSCDCGNKVTVSAKHLVNGATKSCGCLKIDHGHNRKGERTRTYSSWASMLNRCNNPDDKNYHGRGITVCKRWLEFENFLADMGERPEGKTIDRYPDNDGNYEKSNCRWATPKQQADNRRKMRMSKANTSGRTGISWSESRGKFEAYIGRTSLGRFVSFDDACAVRAAAEKTEEDR